MSLKRKTVADYEYGIEKLKLEYQDNRFNLVDLRN